MITAADMAPRGYAPPLAAMPWAPGASAVAANMTFRERLLLTVLFCAVAASCIAFIEPSPHDALVCALAVCALIAGVRFHRILLLPFVLLVLWNVFGLMSVLNVLDQEKTIQYAATSVYLAVAALIFALVFAENTLQRLETMRTAYIIAAVIAAICGVIGYFHLLPGADMFTLYDRATGPFKDPNVFGPFLVLPVLMLFERMLTRRIDMISLAATGIILFGLLLSFSRGAWFNVAVGMAIVIVFSLLTAPTLKVRTRIITISVIGLASLAVVLVFLLTATSLASMFTTRAQLIQSYDVGSGGRFVLQEQALGAVLDFPNGMGPFEFARVYGLQQHNVYLQSFLVYGWGGGLSYILLVLSTLWVAFANILKRMPWQPYAITAAGAFLGTVLESFIIDSDHWRSFFLVLGLIWGVAAATRAATRSGTSGSQFIALR